MRFAYTYRSSDGQRHSAEIEAESRDAAYAAIRRERGVKPIKVVATGDDGDGDSLHSHAGRSRYFTFYILHFTFAIAAAAAIAVVIWFGTRDGGDGVVVMHTPQGVVTSRVAEPLPRQTILGWRQRIEGDRANLFTNAAERLLSRFAEPGRAVTAPVDEKPTEADFRAALREPIRVASNELTEHIDLKRIVAGLKREMRAYLAGGGTVDGYLAELEKRQRLEISYRERAEQKLNGMLNAGSSAQNPGQEIRDAKLKSAYGYWLKANASLEAMGIYPLPLPSALRNYQMSLDIDTD